MLKQQDAKKKSSDIFNKHFPWANINKMISYNIKLASAYSIIIMNQIITIYVMYEVISFWL